MSIVNFFKNRTVLGITCIVLALVVAFGIAPLVNRSGLKNIKIVRANTEIKSGNEITKDMVQEVDVSSSNQPSSIIGNKDEVVGKFATMDMIKGDYVLKDKIADSPYIENTYLSGLNGTNRAISVSIKAFANGLSGKIKSGDIVSVISPNYKKTGITTIPRELQYVEVIAATSKSGTDTNEKTEEGKEKELPSTVTLLASEMQAKLLAELENDGTVHLALVYRGDKENTKKFLKAQEELNNPTSTQSEEVINESN